MSHLQLQVRTARLPVADGAAVHGWLRTLVHRTVRAHGTAPAAAVVVREHGVDLVDLRPVAEARQPLPLFLAGLAGSRTSGGAARAVGLIGRFTLRRGRQAPPVPVALAFLEAEDGRWWQWQALLQGKALVEGSEVSRSAEEGDALPAGLGRWWTLLRVRRVRMELVPTLPAGDDGTVH